MFKIDFLPRQFQTCDTKRGLVWSQTFINHSHVFIYVTFVHAQKRRKKKRWSWLPKVLNAYSLVIMKRQKDIDCTILYVNMVSLIMMSYLMGLNFIIGKQLFQVQILD
jgi:hypothetical protein